MESKTDEGARCAPWDLSRPAMRTWHSALATSNILKAPSTSQGSFSVQTGLCFGGNSDPHQQKQTAQRKHPAVMELQHGPVLLPWNHGQVHTIVGSWSFQHCWLKVLFTELSMISSQMTPNHTGIWPVLMVLTSLAWPRDSSPGTVLPLRPWILGVWFRLFSFQQPEKIALEPAYTTGSHLFKIPYTMLGISSNYAQGIQCRVLARFLTQL